HAGALYGRGTVLEKLNRLTEALASYQRSLAVQPNHLAALKSCGRVLLKLRRFDEALASYDKSIAVLPDASARYGRGTALENLNRPAEALESYKKAIVLNPNYGPIYMRPVLVPDPGDIPEVNPATVYTKANHEQARRVLWCLGMQSSASTWTYNVTRQIAVA